MNAQEVIQNEAQYVLQTYGRPDIVFTHGEGCYLYDTEGNKYLDMNAGIAVTALGHSDKLWAEAVADQAGKLTHISNLYHNAPQAELAKKLVESCFADRVFFCNSGAEANEAALKFARKYINEQGHPNKTKIVAFSAGFHGRTIGALSVTYKEKYRAPFAPLMPDVTFIEYNDIDAAKATIDADTAIVIVEPVQGEGGVRPAKQGFLQALRDLCDQHGAILIFDEVQCGLGRTGRLFAHEVYGVEPDMMTLAKPLAGGLPIGAALMTQKIADVIKPGDHGSTFAGGPLVCRAGSLVLDRVSDPDFLAHVQEMGNYMLESLQQALPPDKVVDVRGMGLMVGVQLNTAVAPIVPKAAAKGVLVINAGEDVIRLVPPLIINKEQIDEAVSVLSELVAEL
ncbi:MAG: acetylornithine transaminase [Anaerolineales bacterium]|nr:acetylornithine transaminase [Anaerolineales bacterium]